ncbi:MAG: AIR synthase-related protein [Oscillospiraceae bacterium]|nr:AIR synthase-related protein [Oscillospiraceae bacterium]
MLSSDSYRSRGVSATKDEVKAAVKNLDKGLFPGAFCQINADLAQDPDYCTVLHADGAGTKSSLAYLYYKETGDLSVFRGLAQDSLVMNTDDMACVGALDQFWLSNTIGRNAQRVGGDMIAEVIRGYQAAAAMLADYGVQVTLTGGETADVGDLVRTLMCDSTVLARLRRDQVVDAGQLRPGLTIIGLASFGQAVYEPAENSGIGSNGLTGARHLLLKHSYAQQYPETYADSMDLAKAYSGRYALTDPLPGSQLTVGQALLSPTRTYLPVLVGLRSLLGRQIVAMVHCTGGGQVKCRSFGHGIRYVKDSLFNLPPLFQAIYAGGEIGAQELYQVFNCGHRLELYCEEAAIPLVLDQAARLKVPARIIGHTEAAAEGNEVYIRSELGEFWYR